MIRRWFISAMLALFCWGIWAVLGRVIGDAITGAQTQALSTLGMLPVMLGLAFSKRLRNSGPITRGSIFAVAAGICGCAGNVIFYEILKNSQASAIVPLTALYPLITILLAVPILKEKINFIQFLGIALALIAIYLFNVQQTQGLFSRWFVIVLIPIFLWGCAGLLQKISTNYITGELSTLWFLAASVPATIILLAREPLAENPSGRIWLLVALIGFTFALGNWAILDAFANGGKASIITPISGLYSMVSIPIAIIFLGERIGRREIIAIAIALAAIIAISLESKPEPKNEAHAG
jgi:drug/metabolite transporter (DMT)-like permease